MATAQTEHLDEKALRQESLPPDADRLYEFVDGCWLEKPMGGKSSWHAMELAFLLRRYLEEHPIGYLFGADAEYQCFPEEEKRFRRPDVSVVLKDRLESGKIPEGRLTIRPDLAVEVVSPRDIVYDMEGRIDDFLSVGVPLIWVLVPLNQTVKVFRDGNRSPRVLAGEDVLDAGEVLPGWTCPVNDLFPPENEQ